MGAFRALLKQPTLPQRTLQTSGRQIRGRAAPYSTIRNAVLEQRRTVVLKPAETLGARLSRLGRLVQSRSPFGSSSRRTFHSSKARNSQSAPKDTAEPNSLSGRLKKLSREYGWSAVGVYLGLTILDFPFCFLLVRTLGTDRIG